MFDISFFLSLWPLVNGPKREDRLWFGPVTTFPEDQIVNYI